MNLVEMVLTAVAEGGEVCVSEIAEAMQIPSSIVSDILGKLEAEGLLKTL
ncbi:MAG: winged helix-turn-helix domain-containing protein [Planctomycetota bacterium]|jgi:Mn-dependent DtxR family transcriptional regulator